MQLTEPVLWQPRPGTKPEKNAPSFGRSRSEVCPKGGIIWFETRSGRQVPMKTVCKGWACRVCQPQKVKYLKMRIAFGCSQLEKFALITFTLRLVGNTTRSAEYVRGAWREQLVWFRRNYDNLPWLKIVELTRKRQPHLHVITGLLVTGKGLHCEDHPHSWGERWQSTSCCCVEHRISREWKRITGDSWIVDCREAYNPKGVAKYLGKYLTKGMHMREEMERIGFARRWSASTSWPKPGTVELLGTHNGEFIGSSWTPGQGVDALKAVSGSVGDPRLEVVGDPEAVAVAKERRREARIYRIEKDRRLFVEQEVL